MAHLGRLEVIPEEENVFERLERLLREHGLMLWTDRGEIVAIPIGLEVARRMTARYRARQDRENRDFFRCWDELLEKAANGEPIWSATHERGATILPPRPTMPSAPYVEKHPPRPSSLEGRPTIPDQLRKDVPFHVELARKAVAGAVVAGLAGALLGLELFFAGIDLLNVLFGAVRS